MEIRAAALKCLIKVLEHNESWEETLDYYLKQVVNPPELTNITVGAVKFKLALDYFISRVSSIKPKKLSHTVKNILRLGIYELEYLKKPDYAVVNSYVSLCRTYDRRSCSFVNAVLRNFIRQQETISIKEDDLSTKYSHPDWLIARWTKNYGLEKTIKIMEFNNRPPKLSLRINRLKTHNIEGKESKYSKDCRIIENSGNITSIPGYKEGFWVVQSESSAMVSEILDPQPGENILDMCAAPGAKTTHIASLIGDRGIILAVDISPDRTAKITRNCARLGVTCVKTLVADAVTLDTDMRFDRVLVDAPCSNTGVFGRRPDARWNKKPEDIAGLANLQFKILNNAARLLKPGGVLVYSTCSIEPEENMLLVQKFLYENSCFLEEKYKIILQSDYEIDGFFIAKLILAVAPETALKET